MKKTFWQLVRFGAVGLLSNAIGYLLYLLMTAAGMGPKLAMTLLYILGVAQTFAFNRRWSFRHEGHFAPALIRYVVAYGSGYLLNFVVLWLCVDKLGYPHQIVQGLMVLTLAALLFVTQKFWVFREYPSLSITARSRT